MKHYASIDLGTNTVRLLVAEKGGRGFVPVYSNQYITRLGEGLTNTGDLIPQAIERTLCAINKLRKEALPYAPEKIWVIATSAVRSAKNKAQFVLEAEKRTGLNIEVVPWGEEARLMLLGVSYGIPLGGRKSLIFDIGGGSTEIILAEGETLLNKAGLDLGVVHLAEKYIKDPVEKAAFKEMERHIDEAVYGRAAKFDIQENTVQLIGTAGTVTTIAALTLNLIKYDPFKVNGYNINIESVEALLVRLKKLSLAERAAIPFIEKGREDLILPGIAIVISIMRHFKAKNLIVSENGLREGIMLDKMASIN